MQRITRKHLEAKIAYLNDLTSSPSDYWEFGDTRRTAIDHFHLDGAYGGLALHRTMNHSGGVHDVFECGHVSARELAGLISAFIRGYRAAKGE